MPNDPELFAIVPVEGKSPPDAICTGPMSEVTTYIGQSIARIAEEERLAQAQRDAEETERHQAEVRTHALQMFTDGLANALTSSPRARRPVRNSFNGRRKRRRMRG
jgi:hypothetical protein